jgi:SAM-dependent methyltransferase
MTDPSLTSFYEAGYTQQDPERGAKLGRWRALGARSKADHAVELCRRAGVRPATVVEIGCGDGALLEALAARGLAGSYDGFELAAPAAEIARGRGIPGAGRIEVYDGAHVPARNGAYDLAVVSHVLEHVPDPAALLGEAARVAVHVLVEVPLEANRSARRPAKRTEAAEIGHIQAFDRAAIHSLAAGSGLEVKAELSDPLPRAHHAFFAEGAAARVAATAKWALRAGLWRLAPLRAERVFTVHYAALLSRASRGSSRPAGR